MHFENANVAHLGDLVFNDVFPYMNLLDETDLSGWVILLDEIIQYFDDDTLFMFGHGKDFSSEKITGRRKDICRMRDYLTALIEYTEESVSTGLSKEEASSVTEFPGTAGRIELWKGAMKMNIETAFDYINYR